MRRSAWLAALLAVVPSHARAASPAGAAVLRLPLSADVAALGAYAAVGGGLSSIGVNPAGVSAASRPELETSFHSGILQDEYGFLGYAHPLKYGVPYAGIAYYNAGTIGLTFSNGTQSTVVAEEDYIGMLGWSMPLGGGVSAGATARFFRFTLAQQATATGVAGDVGLQWETPQEGLRLGASVQNAGPGLKFEDATDPLPLTARAGAAYTMTWKPEAKEDSYYTATRMTLLADGVQVRGETAYPAAGAEFAIDFGAEGSIAVRVGYSFDPEATTSLSYGIGLREGRFSLDYAQAGAGELGNVQYGSLGLRF
jgi:hypothetical protein